MSIYIYSYYTHIIHIIIKGELLWAKDGELIDFNRRGVRCVFYHHDCQYDVNGGGDDGDGDDEGGVSGGNGDDGDDGMLMLMMMTLPVSQTFVNNLSVSYLILDSATVFYEISMKYCDNIGEGLGEIGRKCKELFKEEKNWCVFVLRGWWVESVSP